MEKQSFLQGALILMLAGLINRVIGFILRLFLVRMIGDEGLGLFQMIYPLFLTLLLINTAGFPTAIAKLIPEQMANNNKSGAYSLLRTTIITVVILSLSTAIILFFSANFIARHIYSDDRTYYIILSIIPALLISPIAASLKGFFQGLHTMIPTAFSQITEQLSRLLATLVLIQMLSQFGLKYQAASIGLGISIGELTGFLLLIILFIKLSLSESNLKPASGRNFYSNIKLISSLAVPITLGRIVNSLMMNGEAILIPRQLQLSGQSMHEATSLYGQLSGMAEQLIFLPTVITIALTTSLIPNVSAAYARNNLTKIRHNYQDVIRITSYLGLPIAVIFFSRSTEICQLLFGYPEAGKILATLAFSAPFIYYLQVSHGMLNGLGKPQLALLNLSLGSACKLVGIYYLTRQPALGIKGAALSIGLGYVLTAVLNFLSIGHFIGFQLDVRQSFIKPISASILIYLLNPYLEQLINRLPLSLSSQLTSLLSIFLMLIIYLVIMFFIKAITPEDLKRFKAR